MGMEAFGIVDRLLYGEWLGKPGNLVTQAPNLLLIFVSLLLCGSGARRLAGVRWGASLALALCLLFFCSAIWSNDPQTTVREAVLYLFSMLGIIGVAISLEPDELMDLLARIGFWTAIASLVLLAVKPDAAHSLDGSDMRGIFAQKNVLGQNMVVGALASLHGLRVNRVRRIRNLITLVLVTLVAVMSRSATSCLTIFAFCVADVMLMLVRRGGVRRVVAICLITLGGPMLATAAMFPDVLLELIGKDPTLTGRTDIWAYVLEDIYQKPWLGWGYLAFWSVNNPAAVEMSIKLHWFPPHAHNGLLEIILYVGPIGATYIVFLWARNLLLSVQCLEIGRIPLAMSGLLACIGIILIGFSETVLVYPFQSPTAIFFIVGLMCERAIRAARQRAGRDARASRGQPAVGVSSGVSG